MFGNLFLGTFGNLAWKPCLGTCSWEALLRNLFLGTLLGNLAWEPCLGTLLGDLAWGPGLETWLGNLAWEPCLGTLLGGILLGNLDWVTGTLRIRILSAPTCSGTLTLADFGWKHVPGNLAWERVL